MQAYASLAACHCILCCLLLFVSLFDLANKFSLSQHCGAEARPEGPKLEARRAEPGVGFLAYRPIPSSKGVCKRCKLPQCGPGRSPVRQEFWCILDSSAVLLLDLGVSHSSFCGSARKFFGWLAGSSSKISNYCGSKKILSPRAFSIAGRALLLPPRFRRLCLLYSLVDRL